MENREANGRFGKGDIGTELAWKRRKVAIIIKSVDGKANASINVLTAEFLFTGIGGDALVVFFDYPAVELTH